MESVFENMKIKPCHAEAKRRRATALIRNVRGIAEWKLFLGE
jgi:hypothetical protein